MSESAPSPLYGYLHVLGVGGADLYAAFIRLADDQITLTGYAPPGFSPTPFLSTTLPTGPDEAFQGQVPVGLFDIPPNDVIGFLSDLPAGVESMDFTIDGRLSWPCSEAALAH